MGKSRFSEAPSVAVLKEHQAALSVGGCPSQAWRQRRHEASALTHSLGAYGGRSVLVALDGTDGLSPGFG